LSSASRGALKKIQGSRLVSNWELPVSALVNAVKERIASKATLKRAESSVPRASPRVVPPAPASARAPQGAPERSDWARRLMELGQMAKLDGEIVEYEYEDGTLMSNKLTAAQSAIPFSNKK
jgi:hypothetical protein